MNFYEETIEIYESIDLNSDEKEIALCKKITKLMRLYTKKYSLEEIKNYIIFVLMLYKDIFKKAHIPGKSLDELSYCKRKKVYDILISEL
jgi:hypothetical protein